jgi:uroporphyrinogen III methyltransferase/synthase
LKLKPPFVYLVGAGPGDAGLLTLRGKECLEQADFVLYDQLVAPRLLDYAPPTAGRLCVSDLASHHPDRWPHVNARMIAEAKSGKCVVRLKGGDPLIFGRGGEEAEALRAAGVPYEIVPGVTAALAAGSYLEIPLSNRASRPRRLTGRRWPTFPVRWSSTWASPG